MRLSKLAFFLVCCAACDGADTHVGDSAIGPEDDGGSAGTGGAVDDGGEDAGEDAGPDAGVDAGADAFVDWDQLEAAEIATPEAAEQIAVLECGELDPCGGELVGTWNVTGFCVTNALQLATQGVQNCPDVLAAFERTASGTMRFTADGMQEGDVTISGTQHLVLGDPCMQHLYHEDVSEPACARFEEQLNGGASKHMAACTFDDGECHCDVEVESSTSYSGTYEARGNGIYDGATTAPFCVEGDSLRIVYGGGVRTTALTFTRASDGE